LTLRASGRYRILATSYAAGKTGSYSLALRRGSAAGPRPNAPTAAPVTGRVAAGTSTGAGGRVFGVSVGLSTYPNARNNLPYTADDAFVDVGARTEAEARGLGLRETTPLTLEKRPHRYGDSLLAAPVAGARAGCAALLRAAAGARPARGSVTAAFVVEQGLSGRGILTAVNAGGPFEEAVVLDTGREAGVTVAPDSTLGRSVRAPAARWRLRVRHAGTPVETVHLGEVAALERRIAEWIRGAR